MINGVGSLVLWTSHLKQSLEFYKIFGFPLEEEVHEDGPTHFACEINNFHFAIYSGEPGNAQMRRVGGCSQIGFLVDEVDTLFEKFVSIGAPVIWEPDEFPWGRTAMVQDPDGRPVEFFIKKK